VLEADAARIGGAAGDSLAVGEPAAGEFPGDAPGGGLVPSTRKSPMPRWSVAPSHR